MVQKDKLNLLMIDDNQVYAEALVDLLSHYYQEVNLGFLDNQEDFVKTLKRPWDVLIFGKAYDMGFTDIVGILQDHKVDLPLICLVDEGKTTGRNEDGLPKNIDNHTIRSILRSDHAQIVIATCVLHAGVAVRREVSDIKATLLEAEQRANILVKNSKSAVAYIDEGIHIFVNTAYAELFGYPSPDSLIGLPIIDVLSSESDIKGFKQFLRRFTKGNRDLMEFNIIGQCQEESFEAKMQLATASLDGQLVTQVLTEPKVQRSMTPMSSGLAAELAAAERRDRVTGLPNRLGFEEHLVQVYEATKQNNESAALLFMTVDCIGKINSVLGIKGMDITIVRVAETLKEVFNDCCVLSRFSDNSFAAVIPNIESKEQVTEKAEHIRHVIDELFVEVEERTITTTLSIGGVFIDQSSPSVTELLDRVIETATTAFADSGNIGNVVKFYDPGVHAGEDSSALAEYLQVAIASNKFKLMYQPIYDIETDSSQFFEVLVSLPLADGTEMTRKQFLSVATEYNLIEKIDRWVLINACKQLSKTRETQPDAKILVTLSSQTLLNDMLPTMVNQLMKATGGQQHVLSVQFSEHDLIHYMTVAKKQFKAIKDAGGRVCIRGLGETAKALELLNYLEPSMSRLSRNCVNNISKSQNMEFVEVLIEKVTERQVPIIMPHISNASTMASAWGLGTRYLQGDYIQVPSERMVIADKENS